MRVTVKFVDGYKAINLQMATFDQDIQDYGSEESDYMTGTICHGERGMFGGLGYCHSAEFEYKGFVERLAFIPVLTDKHQTAGDIAARIMMRISLVEQWRKLCDAEESRRGLVYDDSF